MTPVEQITSLYIGYFGRAPDPEGLNYWVGRLNDGFSLSEIAESFSVQAESQTKYPYLSNPNIASPQAFIAQVYMNLFNRMPDAEGLAYWTNELNNGSDVGDFILNVISGAVTDPDQQIIENKVEVGVDFALRAANEPGFVYNDNAAAAAEEVINGVDETDASVEAGKAESEDFFENGNVPGGGAVGDIFTLTTGVDEVTGTANNDTFRAVVAQSLDCTDIIAGGGGNDVLNISANGINDTDNAPVITGIETINNADADELNLASVSGVERINTSVTGASYINAAMATTFALTAAGTVTVGFADDQTGASDSVNLATDLSADGTAVFEFGADAADLENVNLEIGGDDADVDTTVTLDADLDDLETITVTGSGNAIIDNAEATLEVFDASAATGDIDTDLTGAGGGVDAEDLVVTMGSGDDTVTLGVQEDVTVNLGTGDDTFTAGGDNAGLALTLGADNDTVTFTSLTNINDADEADFAADIITISDFNGSEDFLTVGGGTQVVVTNTNVGVIEDADSLFDALTYVGSEVADNAGETAVFQYEGSTYIYTQNTGVGDAGTFGSDDGLIELVGYTGALNATNFDVV